MIASVDAATSTRVEEPSKTDPPQQPSSAAKRLSVPVFARVFSRVASQSVQSFKEKRQHPDDRTTMTAILARDATPVDRCPPGHERCGAYGCFDRASSWCCSMELGPTLPGIFVYPCDRNATCVVARTDEGPIVNEPLFGCSGKDGVFSELVDQTLANATASAPASPSPTVSSTNVPRNSSLPPEQPAKTTSTSSQLAVTGTSSSSPFPASLTASCQGYDRLCGNFGCYTPGRSTCCGDGLELCRKSSDRCVIMKGDGFKPGDYECKDLTFNTKAIGSSKMTSTSTFIRPTLSVTDTPRLGPSQERPSSAAGRLNAPTMFRWLMSLNGVTAQLLPRNSSCPEDKPACGVFGGFPRNT